MADQNRNGVYDSTRRSRPGQKRLGVALLCSPDLVITRVLHDGLGLNRLLAPGTLLSSILEPSSTNHWRQFLRAIRQHPGEQSCRLNISAKGRTVGLWFSAADRADGLEIVGASTPELTAQLRREFFETRPPLRNIPPPPLAVSKEVGCSRKTVSDDRRSARLHANTKFVIGRYSLSSRSADLENLNEEKIRWILAAVHDLRNHVYSVQAYTELLSEEEGVPAGQKMMVKSIHDSTEFMMHLLNDLEEISWAESGKFQLQLIPTNLAEVIDESISLSRPAAEQKGTVLQFFRRDPIFEVNIDPQRIRQVVKNLLDNAIKYSQAGATVHIALEASDNQAVLTVRDNGPGIPADELESIFTPLRKTRARAASSDPGTGLGLAICKRIVEQHGGRIWAESVFGEGSTFQVVLPRSTTRSSTGAKKS